jgi:hypothetical protein
MTFQPPATVSDVATDLDEVELPDHVDWRSAYGRRNTQDFGFPGVHRANRPLQGPGVWIKRSCGHFTPLDKSETHEQSSPHPCRQCSATAPLPDPESSSHLHARKRAVTQPSVAPKVAQTLNVGSPGQVNPNVNDTRSTLRRTVQTMSDLINLVNSAADNFGVDLDKRPSAHDDRNFHNAPYEDDQRPSTSSRRKGSSTVSRKNGGKRKQLGNSPWVQQSRSLLADLSETHVQLLFQLDSLAEDFGEQKNKRGEPKPTDESLQPALNRMSDETEILSGHTEASKIPMVDHQIDQAHLDKVLTRITGHSDRVTAITQRLQSIVEFAPEAIQIIAEAPQAERQVPIENELDSGSKHLVGVYEEQPRLESGDEPASEFTLDQKNVDQQESSVGFDEAIGAEYKQEKVPYSKSRHQLQMQRYRAHTEADRMSQDLVPALEHRMEERYKRSNSLPYPRMRPAPMSERRSVSRNTPSASPEQWLEEDEEVDQPYDGGLETGRTSKPHYRRFPASHEVGTDESFSSDL